MTGQPWTATGRALLAATESLDYEAYDAARTVMEQRGGGDWLEVILAIEAEATAAVPLDVWLRTTTLERYKGTVVQAAVLAMLDDYARLASADKEGGT